MWGSSSRDSRGSLLEGFLLSAGLCLLKTREATHYSASTCSFTNIELSLINPSLLHRCILRVLKNPFGSDHFPLFVEPCTTPAILKTRAPRWKLTKTNWSLFSELTLGAFTFDILDIDDVTGLPTNHILAAAMVSIPMSATHLLGRPNPWWNFECRGTRKKQNKTWGIFLGYPTQDNLMTFIQMRARARYVWRQSQHNSCQKYVSCITSFTSPREM